MGLALLIVIMKALGLRPGGRALERRGALLDPHLRHQLRGRRGDRHPDGVPVRHQLGALLALRRRRHRPDARDGRAVRLLPRVELPVAARLRREAAGPRVGHFLAAPSRSSSAAGSRATSSSPPTRSCSTRSATGRRPTARSAWPTSGAFLLNPWALAQYAHTMIADGRDRRRSSMAAVGAFYALIGRPREQARAIFLRLGVARGAGRRACSSRSRPATTRPSSSRATSRSRWPRWRAASRAGRRAGIHAHRPARRREPAARQPDPRCRASFASSPSARSTRTCRASTPSPRTSGPTTSSCSTTRSTSWRGSARS